MALINELVDITKLAKEIGNSKLDKDSMEYMEKTAKLFRKAKAISASANKYTVVYPVLVSSRISDYKTALAITKQIELECARFIILAAGLQPIIGGSGNEINTQLNTIFTQESLKNLHLELKPATDEEFYSTEYYLDNIRNIVYQPKFRKTSRFVNSIEMVDEDTANNPGENPDPTDTTAEDNLDNSSTSTDTSSTTDTTSEDDEPKDPEFYLKEVQKNEEMKDFGRKFLGIDIDHPTDENGNIISDKYKLGDKAQKIYDEYMQAENGQAQKIYNAWNNNKWNYISARKENSNSNKIDQDLTKLTKEGPTIIKLRFWISGENTYVDIPLAVKAVLKYVDSSDCADLLKRSKTFSSRFMTLIRLISGELCFKEWLLQLDEAKKDVEREKEIGHVPWYRNLLSGKTRWKAKDILSIFKLQNEFVKGKTKEDMPMCTIIFDSTEFEQNARLRISNLLNNRKYADNILNEYMLLAFGIVDNVNEILYLFYAGESEYRVIDLNNVGKGAGSGSDTNAKLLQMLAASIGAMTRH